MDPGTILAVAQASQGVLSLIAKYYSEVKKAKEDIEKLKTEVEEFCTVLRKIQELVQGSNAIKLPSLVSLAPAIKGSLDHIQKIKTKLDPSRGRRVMSCVGLRALCWPFTKKEVAEHIATLERHKTMLSLAQNSDQTALMLGIDQNVSHVQQNQDLAEQDRQLGKLLVADGAAYNSFDQQHEPRCVQNTRVDLLRQVQAWNTDNDKCIFWLNGMAGTGKSTIARTVASTFAGQRHLGASFFFSRGTGDLGHATKFVSTLAHQLADPSSLSYPALRQHISQAVTNHPNVTRQGLHNQWKELIFKPLSMLDEPNLALNFVIDALDECEREEDVKLILQLFVEARELTTVKLKIFLTSRPETPIRLGFQGMPEILYRDLILHDIPRSIVEQDICVFLLHELDQIKKARNLPGDWPGGENTNLLVKRSDCLFIYIATACCFIRDPNWRPQEQLSLILESNATGLQPTAKLDGMYMQILKLSVSKVSSEDDKSRLSKRFRHIIGSIVTLFDVLSTTALASLLKILIEDVNGALNSLHSVLNVPKDQNLPIRLLHPSFRDFLVKIERCNSGHFYVDQALTHTELAKSCLQLLFDALKRNPCNLLRPGTLVDEVPRSVIDHHLSKDVQYACQYWVDHLKPVDRERQIEIGLHDDGRVHDFLLKHLLHWLEALSLMGISSEGVLMINKLDAMVEPTTNFALKVTIYDAKRFILSNSSIIEKAPLQLYCSALVFCPKQSFIKASYLNELPSWITRYPVVEDDWSSILQILEGHTDTISAVNFSSNGQLLASASWDSTIILWDPATGTLRSTLEGHTNAVTAVVFSGNNQHLASASYDQTIRLWNPASGTLQIKLEGHTDVVTAVAFSCTGQLLASGSDDRTVRLWNLATGTLRSTLQSHTDKVTAVAFSGNGQVLASASMDQTIRLWDPATERLQITLKGHTDSVTSVAFSGNGQLLASGSDDRTILLWNPAMGTLRIKLEGHTDTVTAVAFSGDDQVLASASCDRTIRLWDLATGTLRNTLEGHTYDVCAVAFSSQGQLLASASGDETIRLWDPAIGTVRNTHEGHTNWVHAVAFSGDGELLASASWDKTIRLWDSATGTLRVKLEGHIDKITAVTFSGDGQLLASVSDDQTIRVWNPATGTLRLKLEGHTDQITAVTFSGDGQLLASASDDQTVRLWDSATGNLVQQFRAEGVKELSFSSDRTQLETNLGLIELPSEADYTQSPSLQLSPWKIHRGWLTWNGDKVLWLPLEFQPCCSAIRGNLVVIGHLSGRVIFLGLQSSFNE